MATYFVSANGNDNSGDGTINKPWKSIKKGANALRRGDTLYLRGNGGTFYDVGEVSVSTDDVTIAAYKNETPIWDAQKKWPSNLSDGRTPFTPMLEVSGNNAIVDGLGFRNCRGRGLQAHRCDGVTLRNCTTDWSGRQGINVLDCKNILVEDCTVARAIQIDWNGETLQIKDSENALVRNCTIHSSGRGGLLSSRCRNVEFRNNTCYDIRVFTLYVENTDGIVVDSNSVFNLPGHHAGGMIVVKDEYPVILTENVTITNNVVVAGDGSPYCLTIGLGSTRDDDFIKGSGLKNLKIANNTFIGGYKGIANIFDHENTPASNHTQSYFVNNICVNDDGNMFNVSSSKAINKLDFYNNAYSHVPESPVRGKGSGHVVPFNADKGLVNYDAVFKTASDFNPENYKLTIDSQARDAGTNGYVVVEKDFFGNKRPDVFTRDIGLHEYYGETVVLEADFSASPTAGTAPLSVSFKDQSKSTNPITSYFWDFGDGAVSTEKEPVHEYQQGQFTVSLRVATEESSDIVTKKELVAVAAPERPNEERITENLSVLYRFDERTGDTVFDVSGAGAPLDLKISDMSAVSWLTQGLEITKSAMIISNGPATKLNEAIRETNAVTIEAWIKAKNTSQDGPARIVTLSKNVHSRNVTLGQGLWGTKPSALYDLRLRTTERSANGMPSFSSPTGSATNEKTHVVITRNAKGLARFIVNTVVVAETDIPGDFSTWNPRFPLLLANETTGDHPWLGTLYLVAVYNRALSISEITQNYGVGTELAAQADPQGSVVLSEFKRFMLVGNGNGQSAISVDTQKVAAYGVQYPDLRCVLCANGTANSMAVYPDVNAILRAYGKQGLKIRWID